MWHSRWETANKHHCVLQVPRPPPVVDSQIIQMLLQNFNKKLNEGQGSFFSTLTWWGNLAEEFMLILALCGMSGWSQQHVLAQEDYVKEMNIIS